MQQVNLYTDALKPKKVLLSLTHLLVVTVVLVALLSGLTFIKSGKVNAIQAKLEKKLEQQQQIETSVEQMRDRVKRTIRDEQLVAANESLKEKLRQREQLVDLLGSSVTEGNAGFSELMIALGRQNIRSLWLTRMYFGARGTQVGLEGISTKADDVPDYLRKLRDEPAFLGRSFDLFELKEEQGVMQFSLYSGDISAMGLANE